MFLFVRLVLVNCSVLSDHVLWWSRRWDLLLSFCLRGSYGCKDVFSKIFLPGKIFEILAEGPVLESSVSFAALEGVVVFRSGMSTIVWLCFRTLHPGLALDSFEDVLDRELQRSEAVIHPTSSEWTLLVAAGFALSSLQLKD